MHDQIESILVIRRGAIGDIIFTLPAYYLLRANFPNSKISFLVKENYAQVLKGFPGLDEVWVTQNKSKNVLKLWEAGSDILDKVKNSNFQLAIDFSGNSGNAVLLWLSGIKHRWGSIKSSNTLRERLYTNTVVRLSSLDSPVSDLPDLHRIDQNLLLLKKGGLTCFPVKNEYIIQPENQEKANTLFSNWGLSLQKPVIFIQPFTGDGIAGKAWPLERYAILADYWRNQGLQVVFGGGPEDREKLNAVAERFPVAAGQTDFVTSVGLTVLSSIVIGGDTGLMHASLAAGKRTVMLVGPTDHRRIGPYRHPEWAIRPPQGKLVADISVEQVISATKTALDEVSAR
ncbi:glycosyltransferase family 9 protein [Sporomusa sphaeroides DSM 2875]|uniref:glycosyltransferase family 9 protein n=1 Tax=Sporomusa sphaeroides TaxID=47679 RepID=UPI00202FC489|nr:glycosyltransferase family 9 protein [Sporomusa sphaeroides DSM 2875]